MNNTITEMKNTLEGRKQPRKGAKRRGLSQIHEKRKIQREMV